MGVKAVSGSPVGLGVLVDFNVGQTFGESAGSD
jgi:hypothetical protein